MIKLDYRTLNSEAFNKALVSLIKQEGFSTARVAYNISKIYRLFRKELAFAREQYAKMVKPFLVTDENGEFKISEKRHPFCPWEILEGKEESFNTLIHDFLSTEVILEVTPLSLNDMGSVKLSPADLMALEPIFELSEQEAS